jgi:hypothetical protein
MLTSGTPDKEKLAGHSQQPDEDRDSAGDGQYGDKCDRQTLIDVHHRTPPWIIGRRARGLTSAFAAVRADPPSLPADGDSGAVVAAQRTTTTTTTTFTFIPEIVALAQ